MKELLEIFEKETEQYKTKDVKKSLKMFKKASPFTGDISKWSTK